MCVYIYRHLYSYPYRRHYWHSLDSKRNSWICDGARISSLFRLSVSLAARRIAIGNDWDLSGRGAEHSHFSLPSFRDVHLGNGQGAKRERERALELSLIFSFLLVLRARSVSGGFKKGTVMITCRVVTHLFRLARACELVHVRLFSLSHERIKKMKMKKKQMNRMYYVERNKKASRKKERKTKRRKQEASSLFSPFTAYTRIYY